MRKYFREIFFRVTKRFNWRVNFGFKWWPGAIKQQTMSATSVNKDLCHYYDVIRAQWVNWVRYKGPTRSSVYYQLSNKCHSLEKTILFGDKSLWWKQLSMVRVHAFAFAMDLNTRIVQIPQCTCPISHNAPFRTEMCTFLFWIVYCGKWDRCIVGFVRLVYCIDTLYSYLVICILLFFS